MEHLASESWPFLMGNSEFCLFVVVEIAMSFHEKVKHIVELIFFRKVSETSKLLAVGMQIKNKFNVIFLKNFVN